MAQAAVSNDLRSCVVALRQILPATTVAQLSKISPSSVYKILSRFRKTSSTDAPVRRVAFGGALTDVELVYMFYCVESNPTIYLSELQSLLEKELRVRVSCSALCWLCYSSYVCCIICHWFILQLTLGNEVNQKDCEHQCIWGRWKQAIAVLSINWTILRWSSQNPHSSQY